MEWEPTASDESVRDATPPLRPAVPRTLPPSEKVMVPVALAGETLAVKVTAWPAPDGLTEEPMAVVEDALITTPAEEELLPAYVESPLYKELTLCVPAVSVETA